MMQCPSCKNPVETNHYFCGYCGTDLKRAHSEPENLGTQSLTTENGSTRRGEKDSAKSSYIGQIIDRRYQVLDLVARGGMGSVYRAVHIHMRKVVAIKLLHEHILAKRKHVTRFLREARAISRLSNPHTVRVYDFGKYREVFYLVMEFLDGEDLFAVLEREGPLGVSRTVTILDQICSSLEEAHSSGIIHRDLKSENIMVVHTRDGRDFAKVLDFGLAKILDPNEPVTAQSQSDLFGTPFYMAPEQIRGKQIDTRTDLYALGALSFRMLTGTFPFAEETAFETLQAHLSDPVPSPHKVAPELGIPSWLDKIVRRCLAKDPDERFPDVRALRLGLRAGPGTEFLGLEELDPDDVPVSPGRASPQGRSDASSNPSPRGPLRRKFYDPERSVFDAIAYRRARKRIKFLLAILTLVSVVSIGLYILESTKGPAQVQGKESEPNHVLDKADVFPESNVVFGYLGRRLNRTQSDIDVYRLSVPRENNHVLKVEADGIPNMNIRLDVLDHKGELLARIDRNPIGHGETMSQIPISPPHIYVQIEALAHKPGALPTENLSDPYRIFAQIKRLREGEELEPNDTLEDAFPIATGEPIVGQLDTPRDQDYFLISTLNNATRNLEIRMENHHGMPVRVALTTKQGKQILAHTFPGLTDSESIRVARTWPLNKKVFLSLSVGRKGRAWGVYKIGLHALRGNAGREREPNDDPRQAEELSFGGLLQGRLNARDRVDIYRISTGHDPQEETTVEITSSGRRSPKIKLVQATDVASDGAEKRQKQRPSMEFKLRRGSDAQTFMGTIDVPTLGPHVLLILRHPGGGATLEYTVKLKRHNVDPN